jgi:hypothetical protein
MADSTGPFDTCLKMSDHNNALLIAHAVKLPLGGLKVPFGIRSPGTIRTRFWAFVLFCCAYCFLHFSQRCLQDCKIVFIQNSDRGVNAWPRNCDYVVL